MACFSAAIVQITSVLEGSIDESTFDEVFSTRASLGNPLQVDPASDWSNDTFAGYLCERLNSTVSSVTISDSVGSLWLFPDCGYLQLGTVEALNAFGILFIGNSTEPDPLVRLGRAISHSSTGSLIISGCVFKTYETDSLSTFDINWPNTFDAFPPMVQYYFEDTNLGSGSASLPARLPNTLVYFSVANCGLTGTIPATLFELYATVSPNLRTLFVNLDQNAFSGTIPATMFSGLTLTDLNSFTIRASSNKLSGNIPATLFSGSLSSLSSLVVDLSSNALFGPVGNLFASTSFDCSKMTSASVTLSNNFLSGQLPLWFTSNCSILTNLALRLSNNSITGSIPQTLLTGAGFSTGVQSVTLLLNNNKFSGPISSTFASLPSASFMAMELDVSANLLNGSIPADFFAALNWPAISTVSINLGYNKFVGHFPTALFPGGSTNALSTATISIKGNSLMTGTMPVSALATRPTSGVPVVTIDLSNTGLTGALVLGDYGSRTPFTLSVYAANTSFSSLNFTSNYVGSLVNLDISNNKALTGTLPDVLYSSTVLQSLLVGYTSLTGIIPDLGSINSTSLTTLAMDGSAFDFCSGTRTAWTSSQLTNCLLRGTSAHNCANMYPSLCLTNASTGCDESKRPSGDSWTCIGSTWTYYGSYTAPTLTIPSGTSDTIVFGNVSSTSVVITGLGGSLTIQSGCATNLSSVTIELTVSEVEALKSGTSLTIITIDGGSACTDLSTVAVSATVSGKTCRKLKASNHANGNSLSVLFSIDSSSCRTWWIILVAVLASVVVIGVVTLVLLVIFVKPVRYFFRPHSKPRPQQNL